MAHKPLKTDGSAAPIPIPIPIPQTLLYCGRRRCSGGLASFWQPAIAAEAWVWLIERAVRKAKVDIAETERDLAEDDKVLTLPEGFSLHGLRHYLASLLISSGADIRTVQARMRHASARIRLDVYGHLWRTQTSPPARRGAVIAAWMDSLRPADGLASEPAYMQVKGFADLHVEVERDLDQAVVTD